MHDASFDSYHPPIKACILNAAVDYREVEY